MARPAKSVKTQSAHLTSLEREGRLKEEEKLKGGVAKLTPPSYFSKPQKTIFQTIVAMLAESEILGNPDIYILTTCCIAIDRLQTIETMINEDEKLLSNKGIMSAKEKYTKDLYRCCNELSLSPQSRARLASINANAHKNKDDPLLKALGEGDDD